MLSIHLRLGLPSGLFPLASQPITYTRSSSLPFGVQTLYDKINSRFIIGGESMENTHTGVQGS
jgi:hypothetical protein